jgi:DNA-binding SARP family transcriptional activator/tetratricopeptide (TPR) repeat protein
MLSIGILGPFAIECDGRPTGKLPRKAAALLAYLAVQNGRAIVRERLADLLWPYQDSQQARHSLRNCLLQVRKVLGSSLDRHLLADAVSCRLEGADLDLERFERLAAASDLASLRAAADLYRGEFLSDFTIDSEPFRDWLGVERERTLALACDVLQRLTREHGAAGEHGAAVQAGRRLVSLDPFSEPAHRTLMRAYAHAGRRAEALRQYHSCADVLKRELGVAPDAETQALARDIARSGHGEVREVPARIPGGYLGIVAGAPRRSAGPHPPARISRKRRAPALPNSIAAAPQWPCLASGLAVAVIPLDNFTGDASQQDVVEAFTDDLIIDLMARARGISFARLTGGRGSLAAPDAEFDYVVTGSLQSGNGGTLRIDLQLLDAATMEYRWARREEFRREELRTMQTVITAKISRELRFCLLQEASRRLFCEAEEMPGAEGCLARAGSAIKRGVRPELTAEAQRWFLAALALEAQNVDALVGLARTCQHVVSAPWWVDPYTLTIASDIGREAVAAALSLVPAHADANCIKGMLDSAAGRPQDAAAAFAQALATDRRGGTAHGFAGYNAAFLGHAYETGPAVARAMRLDRADRKQPIWFFFAGFAELMLGRNEEAIKLLQCSLDRNPSYGGAQLFMAAALSLSGRRTDADRAAESFRRQYPRYPLNAFEQQWLSRSTSPVYRRQIDPPFERLRAMGIAL